jgi:hypothetical protein
MLTMNQRARQIVILAVALVAGLGLLVEAQASGGRTLFISSATEHPDDTVSFPLHRGISQGRTVWYIILDSSSGKDAAALGVNHAAKLENARGTSAVQKVRITNGMIDFPATVDFSPVRQVSPSFPDGFPPSVAEPGAEAELDALGERHYSPLIELPDGTVRNAPHLANDTGQADKVVNLDTANGTVRYRETNGFQGGKAVKYVSTDSSNAVAAALEGVTFAPALDAAPFPGGDGTDAARASLAAFVNGQTGAGNPERQGLNSALLDGLDPLNVLRWNPSQGRYSPLWDVHLSEWSASAVANGQVTRQRDFNDIRGLVHDGLVTGPGGTPFGPSGFIVNCPIVSSE